MLAPQTLAPAFTLPDQEGNSHSLSDFKGSWVVLYFYPKDDTPGCTKEACTFRDSYAVFREKGIVILGVSKDSVKSHAKFIEKFSLPFTLLSDESTEMIRAYGAFGEKKFMGKTYMGVHRISYLIDPTGMIRKVYPKVNPSEHAGEILTDVETMK
ncbi:thioredoxin-dependent thiol peroxidase [Candidatus Woesebacteria bacterium]|nr:thioredoxin-dependent thiol peroxidase [Candidatus Woesebacteria bacterium]